MLTEESYADDEYDDDDDEDEGELDDERDEKELYLDADKPVGVVSVDVVLTGV